MTDATDPKTIEETAPRNPLADLVEDARRLSAAATEGPWRTPHSSPGPGTLVPELADVVERLTAELAEHARLTEQARSVAVALESEVERLRAGIEELAAQFDAAADRHRGYVDRSATPDNHRAIERFLRIDALALRALLAPPDAPGATLAGAQCACMRPLRRDGSE